jgi:ATP-dependent exoDNAse (exonuclease V) beta subunit
MPDALEITDEQEQATPGLLSEGVSLRRVPLAWHAPLPEPSFGNKPAFTFLEGEPLRPEFDWAGEISRHVGTLVHREIERILRRGLDRTTNESIEPTRYHPELAELGVPDEFIPVAAGRVAAAITRMLQDERGRWLLAGDTLHRESSSELALSGWQRGELVNAVIDRTFVDKSGIRWIVDFKTSTHEGGGLEGFLANEESRYRPQLTRYAQLMRAYRPHEPIKTALYFPLLGVWREVEWGERYAR